MTKVKNTDQIDEMARSLGYIITPPQFLRMPYQVRRNDAVRMLAKKWINAGAENVGTGVFVTEIIPEDIFSDDATPSRTPAICAVFGWRASELLAHGSHRLATEAEIERFRVEQRERDKQCQAMTMAAQKMGSVRYSAGFAEVSKKLGIE